MSAPAFQLTEQCGSAPLIGVECARHNLRACLLCEIEAATTPQRDSSSIDDTLRQTLAVQRATIETHSERIDQVQQQADRADTALTEQGSQIADLEACVDELVQLVRYAFARRHPLFCPACETAYALTGLRRRGRAIELLCPVCGPRPWRGGGA